MLLSQYRDLMRATFPEPLIMLRVESNSEIRNSHAKSIRADIYKSVPEVHGTHVARLAQVIELANEKEATCIQLTTKWLIPARHE